MSKLKNMVEFDDMVIWKGTPNGSLSLKVISTVHLDHYILVCPHFSVHFHTWKQQHIVNGLKLPLNLLTRVRDSNWNVPRFMAFKCKLSAYSKGVFRWENGTLLLCFTNGVHITHGQLKFCSKKYVKLRKQKRYSKYPIVSRSWLHEVQITRFKTLYLLFS